ncbi:MAG: hypothetical protein JXQ82_10085 [Methanomicrobiaceae archaeon]|nr:hypothetical protein [Methanomicrobiaceae archaeon]
MHIKKNKAVILILTVWIIIIITFAALSSIINLEIIFVLWLIGLLVTVELADSIYLQPAYMKYIKIITAAGVFIFGIIVALKVLEIIAK